MRCFRSFPFRKYKEWNSFSCLWMICVNITNRIYLFCTFVKIPSHMVALEIIWDILLSFWVSSVIRRTTLVFRNFSLIFSSILVICFLSVLSYNLWYKNINIMSKIRVNRLWVIREYMNYQSFFVWSNNPELLIPGATFLCCLFGFQVGYKKWRLPNKWSVPLH